MEKILHISEDEKFIDMGINAFELAYPSCNRLIIIKNDNDVKHVSFKNRKVINKNELASNLNKLSLWQDVDVVVLHSLFMNKIIIPEGIRVIWLGFGFDYYDFIVNDNSELLSAKNIKLLNGNSNSDLSLREKIKKILKTVLLVKKLRKKQKIKIIERVDIFCPVLTTEYGAMHWPLTKKPKLMDWNYGTMEDNWAKIESNSLNGTNVLLGNSATKTCNHIDGIDLINELEAFHGKLIIPLSYGDKSYRELVKGYLQANFKGDVLVLEDFMSFDEYLMTISTCSFVVMPHKRQQGLGNIIVLMNLGAKIFLDKENLLYDYLKKQGFIIFTLEDINEHNFNNKLTEQQIINNRNLLFEIWGRNSILKKTIALVECELK